MRRLAVLLVLFLVVGACSQGDEEGHDDTDTTTTATNPTTTTTTAQPGPTPQSLGAHGVVSASAEFEDFTIEKAFDGDSGTWWSAGDHPPQWITVDFPAEVTITSLSLTVSQDPPGETVHQIVVDGVVAELVFESTADMQTIVIEPEDPWTDVVSLEIYTESSPSWVGWREIEILGFVTGEAPEVEAADVVFRGGPILTMSDAGTVDAIAVRGDRIVAVGTEAEIEPFIGSGTIVEDLEGDALMPGIVDPHSHLLNDAWRLDTDTLGGQQLAIENGITTLANLFTTPEFLDEMRSHEEAGDLRARISLYLIATDNCGVPQGDWWKDHPPNDVPGELLRIGGVKLFLDGGTCGAWASTEEPIAGMGLGEPFLTIEQTEEIYSEATEAGHQTVTHAIGDRAILTAISAHQATIGSGNPLRHRIDHLTMVTDPIIEGFQATGLHAAVFGFYPTCATGFEVTEFGTANMRRHPPLIAAAPDSVISWKGDDPWVGPINPFQELHNMVTRVEFLDGMRCEPEPWLAEKSFPVEQALRMMTVDAAFQLRREAEVGSLEPGMYADVIRIPDNPLTLDADAIYDIKILMTMIGGAVEYCADTAFCP
jgi:predicted amidohydrolase YtcJ